MKSTKNNDTFVSEPDQKAAKKEATIIPIIVKNPYGTQEYDLEPFFRYITATYSDFQDQINDLGATIETMLQLIDESKEYLIKPTQKHAYELSQLRDTFRKMIVNKGERKV